MTIRYRIFLFNLIVTFSAAAVVIFIGYHVGKPAILNYSYERLDQLRIEKSASIESYFVDLVGALKLVSSIDSSIYAMDKSHPQYLRATHDLEEYASQFKVQDLMLITADGRVAFTTYREIADGTLVASSELKGSYVEQIYSWSKSIDPLTAWNQVWLTEFAPHDGQSQFATYATLAAPIFRNNKLKGTLIFKVPSSNLDQILSGNFSWKTRGFGRTGEILVYGKHKHSINSSRFFLEGQSRLANPDLPKNFDPQTLDYRGQTVLRSTGEIYLPNGDVWTVEAKMDQEEAYEVLYHFLVKSLIGFVFIIIILPILSYYITHRLVKPLQKLVDGLDRLGANSLNHRIDYSAPDEVGVLVNKYNELADRLEQTTVSKEYLSNVVQSIKESLFIVEIIRPQKNDKPKYLVRLANEAATKTTGLVVDANNPPDFLDILVTSELKSDFSWMVENKQNIEAQLTTIDGHKVPVLINWSVLPKSASQNIRIVFVCTDLTIIKRAEEELIRAREQALNASHAKSEFLARMSHEIRTPLNAIIGMTDLMTETPLNEEQKKLVRIINNASENLAALINDILDISKIEARELKTESISFDLKSLIADLIQLLETKAHSKGLDLKFISQVDESFALVMGDPTRLRQILMNLIGNAIKFTEKGAVTLFLKKEQDHFFFSIKDTGSGISREKQPLLFQSFMQADTSITRKYGGTGLGLVISKNLVELMGGKIGFNSEEGVGSEFYFTIPLKASSESKDTSAPTPQARSLDTLDWNQIDPIKVLVTDDSEDNRFLVLNYLKKWPLQITQAENGQEAVDLCKRNSFDIILMDIQMPVMDGYQAVSTIRKMEEFQKSSRSYMIALSANAMSEDVSKSLQLGFDEHLTKPIKKSTLLDAIERALTYNRQHLKRSA